jgi:hypothetical protein
MINAQELADIFLGEAHNQARSISFQEFSDLTPEQKVEKAKEHHPLPERDVIADVFEEVFWASLLTEESRPCRPRLIYRPRQAEMSQAIHRLVRPVELTREHLRKLTQVQGPLGYLVWDVESNTPEIIGVEGRQGGDPCDFTVAAPSDGALDISWWCIRLVAVRAGRVDRLSSTMLPDMHKALDIIRQLLGNFAPVFLGRTIQSIASEGHGGAVWIVGEGRAVDGIQIGYPVTLDQRPLPERFEQRLPWLKSVGYLAAVDGAVLLDSQLRVLGFGAFVNIPDQQEKVAFLTGKGVEMVEPRQLGGGRHRSALQFCLEYAPAAAVVVSEDGRITVMGAGHGRNIVCAPISILGFSDNIISSR